MKADASNSEKSFLECVAGFERIWRDVVWIVVCMSLFGPSALQLDLLWFAGLSSDNGLAFSILNHVLFFGLFFALWLKLIYSRLAQLRDKAGSVQVSKVTTPLFISAFIHSLPIVFLTIVASGLRGSFAGTTFIFLTVAYSFWLFFSAEKRVKKILRESGFDGNL